MRRNPLTRFASLLPLLLVAACEGGGLAPLPTESVSAGFPPHGLADVIVIDATDRLPLRQAVLIAPDGSVVPADAVDVNERPRFASGLSASSDPSHGGLGELSLPGAIGVPAIHSEGQLLITMSKASIPLPDAVAYRRDWQHYRIRLDFGSPPGAIETREIPAPEPLPAAG